MSLYLKNLEKQEKCTLLERLDMSKDEDYDRTLELLQLVDDENFLLSPFVERDKNDILFFLWDPKNDKICGFMDISYLKNMEGIIDAVTLKILTSRSFKDSTYKKERIGQILIDELINEAKRDPRIDFLTIESVAFNWDAHKFYQKMGFKFVGKSKRPLYIIQKKPTLNRFLYLDGIYPESEGWDRSKMNQETLKKYSEIDVKYDPEGKYTMVYSEDDLQGIIHCKNFLYESFNFFLDYAYLKISKGYVDSDLKFLLNDKKIYDSLVSKTFENKDFEMFKKMLDLKLSVTPDLFLPPLNDIINTFGKNAFYEVMFEIYPRKSDRIKYFIDFNISHPFFQVLEDLYQRRFEALQQKNKSLVIDLNMLMLGLFYYDQKDILDKVLEKIKSQEVKDELNNLIILQKSIKKTGT
jgi:ribosomal protein S18 acetylase RimI-like enzyme